MSELKVKLVEIQGTTITCKVCNKSVIKAVTAETSTGCPAIRICEPCINTFARVKDTGKEESIEW